MSDNHRPEFSADYESDEGHASAEARPWPSEPSVEDWKVELNDVLAGERDYILRRHGSVSAHVEKLIRASVSERKARETFQEALRQLVEEWQPFSPSSDYYVACMLDLIGAYLPRGGFRKILGFMGYGFRFPVIEAYTGGFGSGMDLHMKALVDLEYYYPSADPKWEDDPAFVSYVQVLRQHLEDSEYGAYNGYALSRLIQLNIIKPQEQIVRDTIELNGGVLNELIELSFSDLRRPQLEDDLNYIYTHCFIIGLEAKQVFEQVLKERDVIMENSGEQLKVYIPDLGKEIDLRVPEELMLEVLEEGGERGFKRAMAAAAYAQNEDE